MQTKADAVVIATAVQLPKMLGEKFDSKTWDLNLGERSGSNSAYASITLAGDKLFIGAENGTTVVLRPGRTYKEIARNKVEGFRSSPVFEGERMYLRAFDYLYCFKKI